MKNSGIRLGVVLTVGVMLSVSGLARAAQPRGLASFLADPEFADFGGEAAVVVSQGRGVGRSEKLVTPSIDLTGQTGVTLSFHQGYLSANAQFGDVDVSVNGGEWQLVLGNGTETADCNPFCAIGDCCVATAVDEVRNEIVNIDISSLADNQADVRVRFFLNGAAGPVVTGDGCEDGCIVNGGVWAIENVILTNGAGATIFGESFDIPQAILDADFPAVPDDCLTATGPNWCIEDLGDAKDPSALSTWYWGTALTTPPECTVEGEPIDCNENGVPDDCELTLLVPNMSVVNVPILDELVRLHVADLNNDGQLDIATVGRNGRAIGILIGNGMGGFLGTPARPLGVRPWGIIAGDFNEDGVNDLATANQEAGSQSASVLINIGFDVDGFPVYSQTDIATPGEAPRDIDTADFDGDGHLDLVLANENSDNVSILFGRGDGTFAESIEIPGDGGVIGNQLFTIIAVDIDGDGRPDIATASSDPSIDVLFNNGVGASGKVEFEHQKFVGADQLAGRPVGIATGDLNGDGLIDLISASSDSDEVFVLLQESPRVFGPVQSFGSNVTNDGAHETAVFDFDGDGDLDLATVNQNADTVAIFVNDGTGQFVGPTIIDLGGGDQPRDIQAIDLDNDGRPDLITANRQSDDVSVLLNRSRPPATDCDANGQLDECDIADGAVDENLDGILDACQTGLDCNANGQDDFEETRGGGTPDCNGNAVPDECDVRDGTSSDCNSDGVPDECQRGDDCNLNGLDDLDEICFGLADDCNGNNVLDECDLALGLDVTRSDLDISDQPVRIAMADMDGDNDLDFAVASRGSGDDVIILRNNGDGTLSVGPFHPIGADPWGIVAGDFDGDGQMDLATANGGTDDVSVLLQTGLVGGFPRFAQTNLTPVGDEPRDITAADFDGDGDLDLAAANEVSDDVSIFLNNGDGTFADGVNYGPVDGPFTIVAVDLDGDGDADLITGPNAAEVIVLRNQGVDATGAVLFDLETYPAGVNGRIIGVEAADLNGDGRLDIIGSSSNGDQVAVLLQQSDGTFAAGAVFLSGDGSFQTAAVDIDSDGDLDLLVAAENEDHVNLLINDGSGTFGFLTPIAVGDRPRDIKVTDLDGNGVPDFVTANRNSDDVTIVLVNSVGAPASEDLDGNGIPDECPDDTPELVSVMGSLGATPNRFISPLGEDVPFDQFGLTTTQDLTDLTAEVVGYTGAGEAPTVSSVDLREGGDNSVTLSGPITPGNWLVLRVTVTNASGSSTFDVRLAHQPLDINQDGQTNIRDATAFGQEFSDRRDPRLIDTNGDGTVDVRDATAFGNNWNGVGSASQPWNNTVLPPIPDAL